LLDGELGQVSVGIVIRKIARLPFGLRKGVDIRGAFRHRLSLRRRGARSGVFEVGNDQAESDPDKNAELDRNKMCGFQIHVPKPPPAIIGEIFSETVRPNNLKIWGRECFPGRCDEARALRETAGIVNQ
jgi:hypothetical protein